MSSKDLQKSGMDDDNDGSESSPSVDNIEIKLFHKNRAKTPPPIV
jgi:hypothetical protein